MTKEDLIALGISAEVADKVLVAHKATLDGSYVPKHRFDEINGELKTAKESVKTRDVQLEDLKKSTGDVETLKTEIKALQESNKAEAGKHSEELSAAKVKSALSLQLLADATGKPHDVSMVAGLFDMSKLVLDDKGAIVSGYKEQRETIGKEKEFLFAKVETAPTTPTTPPVWRPAGNTPPEGGTPPAKDASAAFGSGLAAKRLSMSGITPSTETK